MQTCGLFSPAVSIMATEATIKHTINTTFLVDILAVVSHHPLAEHETCKLLL